MKNSKKIFITSLYLLLCGFFFLNTQTHAEENFFAYLHWFQNKNFDGSQSKEKIVKTFCDAVTAWLNEWINFSWIDPDKAKQSLFMTTLCTSNGFEKQQNFINFFKDTKEQYQKAGYSYKKSWFASKCTSEYKDKCNIAELTDNILTQILSDYFTVKEASIFWVRWTWFASNTNIKDWQNIFARNILGLQENEELCWQDSHYPQTCKMLSSQIKSFKKALNNLEILRIWTIYWIAEEDTSSTNKKCANENRKKENLIYCGLLWDTDTEMVSFVDLIYNELERYTLFSVYYWDTISQRNDLTKKIKSEYEDSLYGAEKFETITYQTLEDLSNIKSTYPLHVLLIAYQEKLLYLRDNYISKIPTPLYCLYYKFRNVQRKQ